MIVNTCLMALFHIIPLYLIVMSSKSLNINIINRIASISSTITNKMSSTPASKVKLDQEVCADAEKLVRLYTELADLRRNRIAKLYTEVQAPQLIWNGNLYSGVGEIEAFWHSLPATQHEVICLDAHRIDPTSDDMSLVALAMGKVSIGGLIHAYSQSLVLVLEDGSYKIKSDTYRLID